MVVKADELKKELDGMVAKEEEKSQKAAESIMSPEEKQKLEADKKEAEAKRIEAEAQAKKDAELLVKKDEEIKDEAEKKRKAELLEKQQKEEEAKLSTDDRIKKVKDESQKRIDEISNRLKQVEDKSSKEAQTLRQELELERKSKAELEKKIAAPVKEDVVALVKKEEKERQTKYLQEDNSKPREERREMNKDELDDWMLEDQTEAVAWIQRRELRRAIETHQNISAKQLESKTKNLMEKQIQSFSRVLIKHPELDVKARKEALKAEGKSETEIETALRQENAKYRLSMDIAEQHPEWRTAEDAPELLIAELEKQLAKQPASEKNEEVEALKKQIEELSSKVEELTNPPEEGISSNRRRESNNPEQKVDGEDLIAETMRAYKAPQTAIDAAIKQYREKKLKK